MDVVMVTGAAGGIGQDSVARVLASGQAALGISTGPPDDTVLARWRRIGPPVRFEVCDVTQPGQLRDIVQETERSVGEIVGQVNAAGVFQAENMLTTETTDPLFVLEVNVVGVLNSMQAVAPRMLERGRGAIVNLGSAAGRGPRPHSAIYAASKAAVVSLTQSAAAAWGRQGVRVNAVAPGPVETALLDQVKDVRARMGVAYPDDDDLPLGRTAEPREVGEVIQFLLSSGASYVNGQCWNVCGGIEMD